MSQCRHRRRRTGTRGGAGAAPRDSSRRASSFRRPVRRTAIRSAASPPRRAARKDAAAAAPRTAWAGSAWREARGRPHRFLSAGWTSASLARRRPKFLFWTRTCGKASPLRESVSHRKAACRQTPAVLTDGVRDASRHHRFSSPARHSYCWWRGRAMNSPASLHSDDHGRRCRSSSRGSSPYQRWSRASWDSRSARSPAARSLTWASIRCEAVRTMVLCSTGIQLYAVWRIRHAIRWSPLWPMLAAGALMVPLGVWLLLHVDAALYGVGLGAFLSAYGLFAVFRRDDLVVSGSPWRDAGAGALGGLAGGLAGLSGSFVAIWCSMRGWGKDAQRAVYQPFILVMQIWTLVCLRWLASHARTALRRPEVRSVRAARRHRRLRDLRAPDACSVSSRGERAPDVVRVGVACKSPVMPR